jgi:hypothetical protein
MAIEPDALGNYPCPKCGTSYMQEYSAQNCCAATFVQDVLNAPTAQEPDPTPEADALHAYNASAYVVGHSEPQTPFTGESQHDHALHAKLITAGISPQQAIDAGFTPPVTGNRDLAMGYYTAYGQARLLELEQILMEGRNNGEPSMPVLLLGPTGSSKSRMIRDLTNKQGITYTESNAYPNMDVSLLFGMFRPNEDFMKDGLSWQDGLLTHAISTAGAFFMEEVTRAPQDALGRFFPVTDNGFRTLPLMEKGELSRDIPQDFWFVATANPATAGYAVQRMDRAFRSRFMIMRLDEPVADEPRILDDILGNHPHREAFWKVVLEARNNPESYVNTRDIIMAARAIRGGIDPVRAIEMGISYKYDDFETAITQSANMHYGRVTENEGV